MEGRKTSEVRLCDQRFWSRLKHVFLLYEPDNLRVHLQSVMLLSGLDTVIRGMSISIAPGGLWQPSMHFKQKLHGLAGQGRLSCQKLHLALCTSFSGRLMTPSTVTTTGGRIQHSQRRFESDHLPLQPMLPECQLDHAGILSCTDTDNSVFQQQAPKPKFLGVLAFPGLSCTESSPAGSVEATRGMQTGCGPLEYPTVHVHLPGKQGYDTS